MQSQPASSRTRAAWLRASARRLLALYPPAWRERYADEVAAVLDDFPVTLWTLCDVALGALDVRLRSDLLPRRLTSMAHRIRTSEIAVFAAFVLYCLAWTPLHFVADTPSTWQPAAQAHPELAIALDALNFAGFLAVLAILIGGVPLLLTALSWAVKNRRWDVTLLLVLPLLAALAIALGGDHLAFTGSVSQSGGPSAPVTLQGYATRFGLGLAAMLTLIVSAAVVAIAIRRSELSLPVARFALIPAGLATIAMVVGTVGGLTLLALVNLEARQLGAPPLLEALSGALLLAAAILAIVALWRGVRAARDGGGATAATA